MKMKVKIIWITRNDLQVFLGVNSLLVPDGWTYAPIRKSAGKFNTKRRSSEGVDSGHVWLGRVLSDWEVGVYSQCSWVFLFGFWVNYDFRWALDRSKVASLDRGPMFHKNLKVKIMMMVMEM